MGRALVLSTVLLLGLPSGAAAQSLVTNVDAVPTCRPVELDRLCAFGVECTAGAPVCYSFPSGNGFCASTEELFCSTDGGAACPTGQHAVSAIGLSVCIPTTAELCGGADRDAACFTKAGAPSGVGAFPVAWDHGDCDGDGLANGEELASGVCVPPPNIGVSTGDGCETAIACVDACVGGECVEVEGTAHRYCVPAEGFVHCCGGFLGIGCPRSESCQSSGSTSDDYGFCRSFDYCTHLEFTARLSCLGGTTGFPVEPDEGDCDQDGVPNGAEAPPRDPCVAETNLDAAVPPIDGGAMPIDGGVSPILDAGLSREDAGSTMFDAQVPATDAAPLPDGGVPPIAPQFAGGGGCRCRATPVRRGDGTLLLLGLVALLVARGRQGA